MQFMHQIFTEGKSYIDLLTISEEFLFNFLKEFHAWKFAMIQVDEGSGFSNGSKCMLLISRL